MAAAASGIGFGMGAGRAIVAGRWVRAGKEGPVKRSWPMLSGALRGMRYCLSSSKHDTLMLATLLLFIAFFRAWSSCRDGTPDTQRDTMQYNANTTQYASAHTVIHEQYIAIHVSRMLT